MSQKWHQRQHILKDMYTTEHNRKEEKKEEINRDQWKGFRGSLSQREIL